MNNYIKDITIDKNNNFITVYFLNNAYNIDGSYLTNKNFKLYIKDYFIYKEITIDKVLKNKNKDIGFDFASGKTINMLKAGIIDPVKVTCCALRNANSVVSTLITTGHAVVEK